jgi:hemerythrin
LFDQDKVCCFPGDYCPQPNAIEEQPVNSFLWTEGLQIGVESLDTQHKVMISDIGSIHDSITERTDLLLMNDLFDKLITSSTLHFLEENKLMLLHNYPAFNDHVKQHEIFIDMINNCRYSYNPKAISKIQNELLKLYDWLVKHILDYDKLYMEHFYI